MNVERRHLPEPTNPTNTSAATSTPAPRRSCAHRSETNSSTESSTALRTLLRQMSNCPASWHVIAGAGCSAGAKSRPSTPNLYPFPYPPAEPSAYWRSGDTPSRGGRIRLDVSITSPMFDVAVECSVEFAGPVSPGYTLSPLRRGGGDPCYVMASDGAIWRTSLMRTGPVTARISRSGPCTVACEAWGSGAAEFAAGLPALLGADDDVSGFSPVEPTIAEANRRVPHL